MTAPKHEAPPSLAELLAASTDQSPHFRAQLVAKLGPSDARRAAERAAAERARRTQWGTAGPGGLLAESHATTSVDCATPPQGVAVTGLRQGGDL